jgi:hypothetical protein
MTGKGVLEIINVTSKPPFSTRHFNWGLLGSVSSASNKWPRRAWRPRSQANALASLNLQPQLRQRVLLATKATAAAAAAAMSGLARMTACSYLAAVQPTYSEATRTDKHNGANRPLERLVDAPHKARSHHRRRQRRSWGKLSVSNHACANSRAELGAGCTDIHTACTISRAWPMPIHGATVLTTTNASTSVARS